MYLKGQSSIEYLTTYGWMLGVVAIAGAAIFATVQGQCVQSTSGFTGQDVMIENFGKGENGLSLEIRNGNPSTATIREITVNNDDKSRTFSNEFSVDVGETEVINIPSITESDSCNTFNVNIVYDSGSIKNSTVEGTLTGNVEIGGVTVPAAPTNPQVNI